jgi:hypothetical protein
MEGAMTEANPALTLYALAYMTGRMVQAVKDGYLPSAGIDKLIEEKCAELEATAPAALAMSLLENLPLSSFHKC